MEQAQKIPQEVKDAIIKEIQDAKTAGYQICVFANDKNRETSTYIAEKLGLSCVFDNGHPYPGSKVKHISVPGEQLAQYYFVIIDDKINEAWLESRRSIKT